VRLNGLVPAHAEEGRQRRVAAHRQHQQPHDAVGQLPQAACELLLNNKNKNTSQEAKQTKVRGKRSGVAGASKGPKALAPDTTAHALSVY